MKYWEMILFLLSAIIDVSTNAQEVTCEGEQLINVDILIGHPGIVSPYKPGHILVFRCTDVNQKMHGHRAIECQPDGKWDHPYPSCREITCELQSTTSGVKKIIPEGKTMFRAGESVEIICSVRRLWFFKETSKKFTCQDNGEWDHKPGCEGIRCEVPRDQHVSHPDNYFRGDMKLGTKHNYYCESGYEKNAEEATCTRDGWTPNPLCAGIRCEVPRDQHLSFPDIYFMGDMKLGTKHNYYCESGYEKKAEEATCTQDGWTPNPLCAEMTCELQSTTSGVKKIIPEGKTMFRAGESVEIICSARRVLFFKETSKKFTCQDNGEWDHKPGCEEIRCEVPRDQHVSHPDNYFRGDMKLGTKHNYYCESGYEKNAEEATCTRDGWTPNPLCAVMTASSKCGTPPTVNNADTVEMTKKEYNTGERVEFICFNKYTLDSHPPFSKYLTCQQGEWSGNIKCLKPCTVTVEEMDERGIELAFTDQQKLFAPHDDHITFKCQSGKNSVGFTPRHKCNDGVMTLPKCV